MDPSPLRAELGLRHSQWETALELRMDLHRIGRLPELSKEVVEKELSSIAFGLYAAVFRKPGCDVLDKMRRCLWLFDRYVSVLR